MVRKGEGADEGPATSLPQNRMSTPADARLSSLDAENLPPLPGCFPDCRDQSCLLLRHTVPGASPRDYHVSQSYSPCSSSHSQAQKTEVPQLYTIHGTALTAVHHLPTVALGAASTHPMSTVHGSNHVEPPAAAQVITDQPTAAPAHV